MTISFSGNQQQYPTLGQNTKAVIKGSLVAGLGTAAVMVPVSLGLMNQLAKVNRSVVQQELATLNQAGNTILKTSGLADKGVKILRKISLKPFKQFFKLLPEKISKVMKMLNPCVQIAAGKNAAFDFAANEVLCGNKMPLAQFHELGHAMNFHKLGGFMGKFGNILQNLRLDLFPARMKELGAGITKKFPIAAAALALTGAAISYIALFKNKKATDEKPVGFWDKTTTFIKNNAGKLTFATMLPMVLEEGLASLQGQKLAKKLLSPELFKKVIKSNAIGFSTYLLAAVGAGVAMRLAVKVRDKIAQPNLK